MDKDDLYWTILRLFNKAIFISALISTIIILLIVMGIYDGTFFSIFIPEIALLCFMIILFIVLKLKYK